MNVVHPSLSSSASNTDPSIQIDWRQSCFRLTLVALLMTPAAVFAQPGFFDLKGTSIEGDSIDFSKFRDQVVLVVNTASRCGYTPQYQELQTLYNQYKDQGFVVLGVPSNQFGHQEPGSNRQIKKFCELRFGVTFPLLEKTDVNGPNRHPLFRFLVSESDQKSIDWNFEKFLISREGKVVHRFKSGVKPRSKEIIQAVEKTLAKSNNKQKTKAQASDSKKEIP